MKSDEFTIRSVLWSRIKPDWSFTTRMPGYNSMSLVHEAELAYVVEGEELVITDGQLVLMPAGLQKVGYNVGRKKGSYSAVHFYGKLPPSFLTNRGNRITDFPLEETTQAFEQMQKHWISGTPSDLLCCQGYLRVILGLISGRQSMDTPRNIDPRVERMRQYLVLHVEERTEMSTLARVAGVSKGYAGTLFHQETGSTVQNYANALRVRKAQALLTESSDTLTMIAEECGFENAFYFSTVFKKHTGLSPKLFRRRNLPTAELRN